MSDPYTAPTSSQYVTPTGTLDAIWARIRNLEKIVGDRGTPLRSAAITDGALTIKDTDNNPLLRLGLLSTGRYGLEGLNISGQYWVRMQDGALTFFDTAGTAQIRLGLMSVGGYGLEARDPSSGRWIPLSAIASAQAAASNGLSFNITTPANGTSGWFEYGPAVTVRTYTGKLTVFIGAKLDLYGNKATLVASYKISGATYVGPDRDRALAVTYDSTGMGVNTQAVYAFTHQVNPGTHVVQAEYAQYAGVGEAAYGTVANRTLIVNPD